jgi:hypothetical protein
MGQISPLKPGEYYPRMARPFALEQLEKTGSCPGAEQFSNELAVMRGQLVSLMQRLDAICQVVHPDISTFDSYGHEIRNLLLLACTEVEASWRGVLGANGISGKLNTNDYVKLQAAMRLGEYGVGLPYYPWLKPFYPFKRWRAAVPTGSLPWYQNYQLVKHDRQFHFDKATLLSAFQSVCACAVMMWAQFGFSESFRWRMEFGYFFQVSAAPAWRPSQIYRKPSAEGENYSSVHYPFK